MAEQHPAEQHLAELLGPWNPARPLCAPYQTNVQDLHRIDFDVEWGPENFEEFTRRRMIRSFFVAPLIYYGRPVTPMGNPGPNPQPDVFEDSHYIVRLLRGGNQSRIVEMLFSDVNMYYKGFRTGQLNANGDYEYSQWFKLKVKKFPSFIQDFEELEFSGGYDDTFTVGGFLSLEDIFESQFRHPTRPLNINEQLRACLRGAFFFSEVLRLWTAFAAAKLLLRTNAPARKFGKYAGKRIKSWKVLCYFVFSTGRLKNGVIDATQLQHFKTYYKIESFDHLIAGERAELRLLLWNNLLLDSAMKAALARPGAHLVADPGFVAPGFVVPDVDASDPGYVAPYYRAPAPGFVAQVPDAPAGGH